MVITAQQRNSKGLPAPDENSRMPGFVAFSSTAGNQQHPTPAATPKTGATRIASAVSFSSGQDHDPVKSDRFMRIFCSFPEKVLGDSGTMTRRKARTEIITLKRMVHHRTARHLPESGTELRYIRDRLGHKSIRMTEIYPVGTYFINWLSSINPEFSNGVNTHVSMKSLSNIKNPSDDFDI